MHLREARPHAVDGVLRHESVEEREVVGRHAAVARDARVRAHAVAEARRIGVPHERAQCGAYAHRVAGVARRVGRRRGGGDLRELGEPARSPRVAHRCVVAAHARRYDADKTQRAPRKKRARSECECEPGAKRKKASKRACGAAQGGTLTAGLARRAWTGEREGASRARVGGGERARTC